MTSNYERSFEPEDSAKIVILNLRVSETARLASEWFLYSSRHRSASVEIDAISHNSADWQESFFYKIRQNWEFFSREESLKVVFFLPSLGF